MLAYSEVKSGIESIGRAGVCELLEELGANVVESLVDQGCTIEEVAEAVDEHDADIVKAAHACDVPLSDIAEAYQGHYRDDEDFAYSMAEQLGELDKNAAWPHSCIDWTRAARDLMMDYSEDSGHYFRNL